MTDLNSRHQSTEKQRAREMAGWMIIPAALALASPSAHAETKTTPPQESTAYVQASRASLRARPEPGAAVLAMPATNTRVRVLAMQGDWCEVELLSGEEATAGGNAAGARQPEPKAQEGRHGFIACGLLAAQALTLQEVQAQLGKATDPKELLNLKARAFWIAPSLVRWATVGDAIGRAGIARAAIEAQPPAEDRPYGTPPPPRPTVPEFQAMKERLAAGILVRPETYSPPLALTVEPDKWPPYFAQFLKAALGRVQLPAIRASLFNARNVPAIIPGEPFGFNNTSVVLEMADALSASNGAAFRAVVTAPEHYGLNAGAPALASGSTWKFVKVTGFMEITMGIWDVGGLRITFDRNAVLHGITAQGRPTAMNIREMDLHIGYDAPCTYDGSTLQLTGSPVKGYAPPDSAWIRWAGEPMPGGSTARAQIKSRQFSGKSEYDLVVSSEVDLDRDGVPDLLRWKGRHQTEMNAEGIWEATFANVDGQWRLLRYNEDADCD